MSQFFDRFAEKKIFTLPLRVEMSDECFDCNGGLKLKGVANSCAECYRYFLFS